MQAKMEDGNDPLAVESAVDGSTGRIPFVDPTSVRCPATYYAGSKDWVLPHVRADVTMLGATLDIIPDQAHLGAFFAASETVLGAVGSRLRRDARDGRAVRGVPSVRTT
ncbi:MAG TPA: hypothetical protein VGI44_12345 [Acidimicrobiales bacterium]